MRLTRHFPLLSPERRPQDLGLDGSGLRFETMDSRADRSGYLVGNQLTLADLDLLPVLDRCQTGAGRGRSSRCRHTSQPLFREACGPAELSAHHATRKTTGTLKGYLG